jgi:hypothetical protein
MSSLSKEYRGVLSVLRFFRRSGQLYMISRFANATDSKTALAVLEEMLELIYRLQPKKVNLKEEKCRDEDRTIEVCFDREIGREDAEWYRSLGAIVCEGGERVRVLVECPGKPTLEELEKLKEAINNLEVRPSELAALAMARLR